MTRLDLEIFEKNKPILLEIDQKVLEVFKMLTISIWIPVNPTTRLFHPYQHLPGASLSLQMLNSNKSSGNGSCVYLRPEQNIPEVFANPGTVFKPIDEVDNGSDVNDNNENRSEGGAISRDDIVVTMRSVNVWFLK